MLHLALQGVLPGAAAVPAAARRHDLEVPRDVSSSATAMARELGLRADRARQPGGRSREGINPFTHGSQVHTDVMKTAGAEAGARQVRLRRRLRRRAARRGEESRAKERIFSFRTAQHRWDPKNQRPGALDASTTRASARARASACSRCRTGPSSTSGSTSTCEDIPIVPLYFAARAAGGRARRRADHGRRRAHAARARRGARDDARCASARSAAIR